MACGEIKINGKTQICCSTLSEAIAEQSDTNDKILDAAIDIGLGAIDTASALFHFPEDLVKYITGTDKFFGQRRAWSYFGSTLDWDKYPWETMNNPLTRLAETANGMVYGGFDLMLGHIPNMIINDGLNLDFPYFSPAPTNAREFGRDISMVSFMLALPIIKSKAKTVFFKKDSVTEFFKELGSGLKRAGDIASASGCFSLLRLFKSQNDFPPLKDLLYRNNNLSDIQFLGEFLSSEQVKTSRPLKLAGKVEKPPEPNIFRYVKEIGTENFFKEYFSKIIELSQHSEKMAQALKSLVENKSFQKYITGEHVNQIIEAAKYQNSGFEALIILIIEKTSLFEEAQLKKIIDETIFNKDFSDAAIELSILKKELFTDEILKTIEANSKNEGQLSIVIAQLALQDKPSQLFKYISQLKEMAKENSDNLSGLAFLAQEKPKFAQNILTQTIELAKMKSKTAGWAQKHATFLTDMINNLKDSLNEGHLDAIIKAAKKNQNLDYPLRNFINIRSDLVSAKHVKGIIKASKAKGDLFSSLVALAEAKSELYISEMIPDLINLESGLKPYDTFSALLILAETKPDLFLPEHIALIENLIPKPPGITLADMKYGGRVMIKPQSPSRFAAILKKLKSPHLKIVK